MTAAGEVVRLREVLESRKRNWSVQMPVGVHFGLWTATNKFDFGNSRNARVHVGLPDYLHHNFRADVSVSAEVLKRCWQNEKCIGLPGSMGTYRIIVRCGSMYVHVWLTEIQPSISTSWLYPLSIGGGPTATLPTSLLLKYHPSRFYTPTTSYADLKIRTQHTAIPTQSHLMLMTECAARKRGTWRLDHGDDFSDPSDLPPSNVFAGGQVVDNQAHPLIRSAESKTAMRATAVIRGQGRVQSDPTAYSCFDPTGWNLSDLSLPNLHVVVTVPPWTTIHRTWPHVTS